MHGAPCPCLKLKHGAGALAFCAYIVAWSRVLLGGDFGAVIAAAFNGALPPDTAWLLASWVAIAAVGTAAAVAGYLATLTHYDHFDLFALAAAVAGSAFFFFAIKAGWSLPASVCGEWLAVLSRGVFFAGLSYNAADIWLQLRGPLAALAAEIRPAPAPRPPLQWPDTPPRWDAPPVDAAQLAEYREVIGALSQEVEQSRTALVTWQQAVAERDRAISDLAAERDRLAAAFADKQATCDRFAANGKHYKTLSAQSDCLLQFPGALKALEKVVHPNAHGGASPDTLRQAHEAFCALSEIRDRLGARR